MRNYARRQRFPTPEIFTELIADDKSPKHIAISHPTPEPSGDVADIFGNATRECWRVFTPPQSFIFSQAIVNRRGKERKRGKLATSSPPLNQATPPLPCPAFLPNDPRLASACFVTFICIVFTHNLHRCFHQLENARRAGRKWYMRISIIKTKIMTVYF